jgi:hypothetical protein
VGRRTEKEKVLKKIKENSSLASSTLVGWASFVESSERAVPHAREAPSSRFCLRFFTMGCANSKPPAGSMSSGTASVRNIKIEEKREGAQKPFAAFVSHFKAEAAMV